MANQAVSRPTTLSGTWGEFIGEFIGTMVLVIFGDGCITCFGLFTHYPSPHAPISSFSNMWLLVTLGWGFAIMLAIYVAGAISGAHINPAVTLGLDVTGRHPWSKVLPYWLAQLLGAFFAAAILYFIYRDALNATLVQAHSTDFATSQFREISTR